MTTDVPQFPQPPAGFVRASLARIADLVLGRVPVIADCHDQDLARQAYVDCMEVQLGGFGIKRTDWADELKPVDGGPADFASSMAIETRIAGTLDEPLNERLYWIVRDRLNRVGSVQALAEYARWAPTSLQAPGAGVPQTQSEAARQAVQHSLIDLANVALKRDETAGTPGETDLRASYAEAVRAVENARRRLAVIEAGAVAAKAMPPGEGTSP